MGELERWRSAAGNAVVCGLDDARRVLFAEEDAGRLSSRRVDGLLARIDRVGVGRAGGWSSSTTSRFRAQCRALGIMLDWSGLERREVPLGQILEGCVDAFARGCYEAGPR